MRWDENDRTDEMLFCMPYHVVPICKYVCAFWHRQLFFIAVDILIPTTSICQCPLLTRVPSIYTYLYLRILCMCWGGSKYRACILLADGNFFLIYKHRLAFIRIHSHVYAKSVLTAQSCCFYISVYPLIRNSFPFCFWNNTLSVIYFFYFFVIYLITLAVCLCLIRCRLWCCHIRF